MEFGLNPGKCNVSPHAALCIFTVILISNQIHEIVCLFKQLYAKKGNVVFGKIGRVASSDVVIQLVKTKCLYYAIEVCPTNKSDVLSLQYVIDTGFIKIINVKSKDVVH